MDIFPQPKNNNLKFKIQLKKVLIATFFLLKKQGGAYSLVLKLYKTMSKPLSY
jgi:hypothetical protein